MNFHHLFIPHQRNNHRAKILHNISLVILIIAVGIVSSFSIVVYKKYPQVLGVSYQISEVELLNLTNYERTQKGLPPLSLNNRLSEAAHKKNLHMFANNYWAHFAPDGTSPWDFIRGEGYNYSYAGENLAKGFTTSYEAVKAWMASPTHRANILSSNYKEVGFSIGEGRLLGEETVLIVQEFGTTVDGIVEDQASSPPLAKNSAPNVQGLYQGEPPQASSDNITKKPFFDFGMVAKGITFILLASLLVALVLDFIIIERKKIPRIVGNNLDHIMLVTIFLAFLLMARIGRVI